MSASAFSFRALGTGTALPDAARGPTGFVVSADGRSWLVDGGSGTLQKLAVHGVDPATLAGGIYSHHHPDHCADLVPLLFAFRIGGRTADYPIHAGEGFRAFFERLRAAWGRWIDLRDAAVPIVEHPLDRVVAADLGGLVLRTAPAAHNAAALHLRFEAHDRAIVFSGDTGPSDALVDLARGADLLVCECGSGASARTDGHLAPDEVIAVAAAARPRRLWVTHLHADVDEQALLAELRRRGIDAARPSDGDAIDVAAITA